MKALCEQDGTPSFTRLAGFLIVLSLIVVLLAAAVNNQWSTVVSLSSTLAMLAGGLYGFNRAPEVFNKPEVKP